MNRKDINDIIKHLPFSSEVIGAPRKVAAMADYLKCSPKSGNILHINEIDFTRDIQSLPLFFNNRNYTVKHRPFITKLHGARVWGKNGAVIGTGDYFIGDVSREFNEGLNLAHSVFYTIKQVKCEFRKGNIGLIGTAGAGIYYHWMLDILPRLSLISKMISLEAIHYFITEFNQLPFQVETLKRIGIPATKILASNNNWNFHVKAETLFVPSLAGPLDQPDTFQIGFVRNLFKDCLSTAPHFRKIYISRNKIGRRQIINEEVLIDYLLKKKFEIIYCEDLSVEAQARLFSEASIIIGSHGSAFTNLVFCKPGAKVLDIFNPSHINACFWFISRVNKLDYNFICGNAVSIDDNRKNDNTIVDIDVFENFLETKILNTNSSQSISEADQ